MMTLCNYDQHFSKFPTWSAESKINHAELFLVRALNACRCDEEKGPTELVVGMAKLLELLSSVSPLPSKSNLTEEAAHLLFGRVPDIRTLVGMTSMRMTPKIYIELRAEVRSCIDVMVAKLSQAIPLPVVAKSKEKKAYKNPYKQWPKVHSVSPDECKSCDC